MVEFGLDRRLKLSTYSLNIFVVPPCLPYSKPQNYSGDATKHFYLFKTITSAELTPVINVCDFCANNQYKQLKLSWSDFCLKMGGGSNVHFTWIYSDTNSHPPQEDNLKDSNFKELKGNRRVERDLVRSRRIITG